MVQARTPEGYKGIGDAAELGDCYNVVESVSDLPPAVGGVRTLPAGAATLICGVITLPAGEKIVVPNDSTLSGRDADLDGILGDVDDALIDTTGNGIVVSSLFVGNANAGAGAYGIRTTTNLAAPRVSRVENVSFFSGLRGLLLDNTFTVSVSGCIDRTEVVGITFRGACTATQITGHTQTGSAPTARGILFEAGSVVIATRVSNCQFDLDLAGRVAVEAAAGSTLVFAAFFSNAFIALTGPPFATPLVGLSPNGQADVLFLSNFGVGESQNRGSASVANPGSIVTSNPGAGTWVRVGNGNPGTHPLFTLDAGSARVSLDQPAGAETARIVNDGIEPVTGELMATLSLGPSGVAAALRLGVRLVLLPAGGGSTPLPPEIFTVTSAALLGGSALSVVATTSLQPGDAITIEVQNATDGTDMVVESADFGFLGA